MYNIIFIHGLESSGKGFKGQFFRRVFPECLTPDFEEYNPKISIKALLEKRMTQLNLILEDKDPWIIIGSSFGGLMGALYTCQNPKKISKLILLAPYLSLPELNPNKYSSVNVPVIVFHGERDRVAPINQSRSLAELIFTNLIYNIVNDNHYLHKTVKRINWRKLIESI
ncbi:MAG: alpha/beta hydrolase [Candidatus Hodarchaeota archaeon]